MCGDSTSVDDMEKLTAGQMADMWLTDPPYNVAYGHHLVGQRCPGQLLPDEKGCKLDVESTAGCCGSRGP